jgi:hypothetical protein
MVRTDSNAVAASKITAVQKAARLKLEKSFVSLAPTIRG